MAPHDRWHDRGVHHPQAVQPADAQRCVDHGERVLAHAAAAHRVVQRLGLLPDEALDLGVAADAGRGLQRLADEGTQGGRLKDAPRELDPADQGRQIVALGVGQVAGVK